MTSRHITLDEQVTVCHEGETVLDALLREGRDVPYSCRQGACQSCMMRSLDGMPTEDAQKGLKNVLCKQNYFLACLCFPSQDMVVALSHQADFFTEATVVSKVLLNQETLLLTIQCKDALDYYAGQFVNLKRSDGLMRSYSIANSKVHTHKLTFHIRRLAGGRFSEWVHQELNIGDIISVSDPQGLCFYLPDNQEQNMLLIGTGSGLAPLAGIIEEALEQGHTGQIHLYHGSREMDGLYWLDEMQALQQQHENFHYTPCVSRGDAPDGVATGRANDVAMAALPDLKGWRVFLCGHPDMVNQTKTQVYLNGASLKDIYSDAFHVASSSLE
ncbi:MAG: 2Fe-2S iron-sulfur cluster-binding protein [Methylicorpusculum sp.]|uniref:2Fe-2S iron-sulfur cluster-binding protein n=1 Tax=Methylicorpusculum sp. TaxID=2713644 RepID=UPI00271C6FCC|nr:2Fe-2S iron-sulfur cluster-binding protein [Methylicorpusculum sp.]MDO8940815.1 2Fe-2S iron-sulfur cluster-binding protein [Methylicorpusculum sp.]MDO9240409.1 2Fe-2S iron-sulfur cluster-binding protein [Methylicorpusculum sp.]MDP2204422.1 2Fe-2S iron-sulfur cluster-binding protein [Methylicorpusculum sp.]